MQISASMVKELRERTGAGMMECKRALTASNGDMEAAIEAMRKSGAAKADKKAGRIAAEGKIEIGFNSDNSQVAIVEVNSETDFVAKDADFAAFTKSVAQAVLASGLTDVAKLAEVSVDGTTIEKMRQELVAKIGENIQVRRAQHLTTDTGKLGLYQHGMRIGVVAEMNGGDDALVKDLCMHIAASKPLCINETEVPSETLYKEKDIFTAQALESGKPPEIAEKIVAGRMKKYLGEITLLGQSFIKDPDVKVSQLLQQKNAEMLRFVRYEVGEGIEKKQEDFAAEVMAQVKQGS